MFQTHCYDSWLSRSAKFALMLVALGGRCRRRFSFFLQDSVALVTEKMREKGIDRARSQADNFAWRGSIWTRLLFVCRVLSVSLVAATDFLRVTC